MVKIRLTRTGRHYDASYRIVVADSHYARDGRIIEQVGFYDPKASEVRLEEEKILAWLNKGAQPSDTVKTLLSQTGVLKRIHEETHKKGN